VKRTVLIVAGPNGTGKSTLAEEHAKHARVPLISADRIAYALSSPSDVQGVRVSAARAYYRAIDDCIERGASFVVETTLAGRGFLRPLGLMRRSGYLTSVAFLFLDSEEACLARVRERVRKGGHDVAEPDVRRVFRRSAGNFWNLYRRRVDTWHLLYNGGTRFREIALGTATGLVAVRDDELLDLFLDYARASRETIVNPPAENLAFLRANELLRAGNRAARRAQEESRRARVPNVYVLDGILQYEVAKGRFRATDPSLHNGAPEDRSAGGGE